MAEHVLTHRRGQQLVLLYWDPVWTAEDWAAEDQPSAAQGLRVYTVYKLITLLDFSI